MDSALTILMAPGYIWCWHHQLKPYIVFWVWRAKLSDSHSPVDSIIPFLHLGGCGHSTCGSLVDTNWRSLWEDQKQHQPFYSVWGLAHWKLEQHLSLKNFLWWLFFLSTYVLMLLGQRRIFHPTSSCSLHGHTGKTRDYLAVCTLSLEQEGTCSQ